MKAHEANEKEERSTVKSGPSTEDPLDLVVLLLFDGPFLLQDLLGLHLTCTRRPHGRAEACDHRGGEPVELPPHLLQRPAAGADVATRVHEPLRLELREER